MKNIYNRKKGFTLIELLIVIAIIGVLASVVLASLTTSRRKADDVRRISDMKAIRVALELYGQKNAYDYSGLFTSLPAGNHSYASCAIFDGVAKELVSLNYLPSVPIDPHDVSAGPTCYHMWRGVSSIYGTIIGAYALEWQNYHNIVANRRVGFVVAKTGDPITIAQIACNGTTTPETIAAFQYPYFGTSDAYASCVNSSNGTIDELLDVSSGQ